MIKKNTKMIFEGGDESKELMGGIPLSKGEIIKVTENGKECAYEVVEKIVNFNLDGDDQIADIAYRLQKVEG